MAEISIPKRLSHVWIGPYTAPTDWMQTWRDKHPDWDYQVYDNAYLQSKTFRTQKLIDEYMKRGLYSGVADLIRYEVLFQTGGFMPGADSVCLENCEPLFDREAAYTVYENEFLRGKLVSPILACAPQDPFVGMLLDKLETLDIINLDAPWKTTGNKFVAEMIEAHNPNVVIFPSHTLIPVHFEGRVYTGSDTVYAKQMFGSGRKIYGGVSWRVKLQEKRKRLYQSRANKLAKAMRERMFESH